MRLRGIVSLAALASALGSPLEAAVLRVPEDHASIWAAVDAAVSGDSVLVGPGTWTATTIRTVTINGQSVSPDAAAFLKPGISVIGTAGPASTIVDVSPSGEAFVYGTAAGSAPTVVEGFSVTGSEGFVVSQNSPLEVRSCWLLDNSNVGSEIWQSSVAFRDCLFEGNEWTQSSVVGAVWANSSTLEFYNCTIQNNGGRGLRLIGSPSFVMDSCWVAGNDPGPGTGGGLRLEQVADLQVRNSWFVANKGTAGGAIAMEQGSAGKIEFCVFAHDSATGGGAIDVSFSTVRISNNTFYACDAVIGSALSLTRDAGGVDNNVFAYCTAFDGALLLGAGAINSITGCNVFWNNQGGDFSVNGTWTAAPTDIFADPQFCDHPNDDLTLHSTSPAVPLNSPSCGLIGALGVGCGPVSVERTSWGRIKGSFR